MGVAGFSVSGRVSGAAAGEGASALAPGSTSAAGGRSSACRDPRAVPACVANHSAAPASASAAIRTRRARLMLRRGWSATPADPRAPRIARGRGRGPCLVLISSSKDVLARAGNSVRIVTRARGKRLPPFVKVFPRGAPPARAPRSSKKPGGGGLLEELRRSGERALGRTARAAWCARTQVCLQALAQRDDDGGDPRRAVHPRGRT